DEATATGATVAVAITVAITGVVAVRRVEGDADIDVGIDGAERSIEIAVDQTVNLHARNVEREIGGAVTVVRRASAAEFDVSEGIRGDAGVGVDTGHL